MAAKCLLHSVGFQYIWANSKTLMNQPFKRGRGIFLDDFPECDYQLSTEEIEVFKKKKKKDLNKDM